MSEHYGQFDRSGKVTRGDLERALHILQREAEPGYGWAHAILTDYERLKAENKQQREALRAARDYLDKYASDTLLGADVLVGRIDGLLECAVTGLR